MKFLQFQYIAQAEIELTWTEVQSLMLFSERHYDRRCVQASQIGGILWGFRHQFDNDRHFDGQVIKVVIGSSDLNLLMKIAQYDPALLKSLTTVFERIEKKTAALQKGEKRR